jgi:hypothetical protein
MTQNDQNRLSRGDLYGFQWILGRKWIKVIEIPQNSLSRGDFRSKMDKSNRNSPKMLKSG